MNTAINLSLNRLLNDTTGTLPYEFRGSIIVFVSILGLARLAPVVRMAILAGLSCFCMYNTSWQTFCFLAGTILAELRLIREESNEDLRIVTPKLKQGGSRNNLPCKCLNLQWHISNPNLETEY
jgi:hypothetical protein